MSDYQKDLDRFMSAWEMVQRDMQAQERVEELAARPGMTVEDVRAILDRLDKGYRLLHASNRPSRAEIVEFVIKREDSK